MKTQVTAINAKKNKLSKKSVCLKISLCSSADPYIPNRPYRFFSHSYRSSWYYQSFIYSPTDTPVSCLKKTILKFTLKFTPVSCLKNNFKIYIKIYTSELS
jgi:hypothetical protein